LIIWGSECLWALREREREREKKLDGGSDTLVLERGHEKRFSRVVLKVPRQYPLVLLVQARFREREASGSEKLKFQYVNFVVSKREKLS
jgi:hypothetical protein